VSITSELTVSGRHLMLSVSYSRTIGLYLALIEIMVHPVIIILVFRLIRDCRSDEGRGDILDEQWKLVTTSYLKYNATKEFLDLMKQSFPENFNFYSIGNSVEGREMHVARMGKNVDKPEIERPLLNPKIRMIGNIHGDDTLGKQLLLMLIVDLLKQYNSNSAR